LAPSLTPGKTRWQASNPACGISFLRSAPAHGQQYYQDWLATLKTLDFDGLSRKAQVDYLFLKKTRENQIALASVSLPMNPPRKTDDTGIPGAARGRGGLIWDLQEDSGM
jgi:hypothetical protein